MGDGTLVAFLRCFALGLFRSVTWELEFSCNKTMVIIAFTIVILYFRQSCRIHLCGAYLLPNRHCPLLWFAQMKNLRWAVRLASKRCKIVHSPGRNLIAAPPRPISTAIPAPLPIEKKKSSMRITSQDSMVRCPISLPRACKVENHSPLPAGISKTRLSSWRTKYRHLYKHDVRRL